MKESITHVYASNMKESIKHVYARKHRHDSDQMTASKWMKESSKSRNKIFFDAIPPNIIQKKRGQEFETKNLENTQRNFFFFKITSAHDSRYYRRTRKK